MVGRKCQFICKRKQKPEVGNTSPNLQVSSELMQSDQSLAKSRKGFWNYYFWETKINKEDNESKVSNLPF